MIDKPIFTPSFHVEVVDPEGVFLLSERGHFVLKGPLHCRLASLMDGSTTADEIVDELASVATATEVYFALGLLEKKGYIVEADGTPYHRAAFWHALEVDPGSAERRLRDTTVSLVSFGDVSVEPLESVLRTLGIKIGPTGNFKIVMTDDYLQNGLDDFNVAALRSYQPWLLVKPLGTVHWIGPLFRPGASPCWECLADRLRSNREVESYLQGKKGTTTPFPVSGAALPATVQATLHLAAVETTKAIARGAEPPPESAVITLDAVTLEMRRHTLVSRPQCRRCGVLSLPADREPPPPELRSQRKQFTADGGHRTASPEQTFAKYEHHISPITGAVSYLSRAALDDAPFLHVYVAGQNVTAKRDNRTDSLSHLRHGLQSKSGGKGLTDSQARASALCEALERYSGNFQGNEPRRLGSYRRLGGQAIHPNSCMIISEAQYRQRNEWNARASRFHCVPDPFDEDADIEWTPVWSLTDEIVKYVPTSYCYYGYSSPPHAFYCWADSNGNAAGNTHEEAIVHGFLELVERDAVCLWWYNRLQRPGVDLDTFNEPYIRELRKHYCTLNRELWVLDLMSDLQIPTFAAISRRTNTDAEEILMAFGAHFDPRIALLRALTELNQYFPLLRSDPAGHGSYPYADPERRKWWTTATLANQPYLTPDSATLRTRADYDSTWSDDLLEDVLRCKALAERHGMEMLVLDQTRPDIGLPVVKVIVPGLRHFWVRLGPGRLYDVPVKLGWLREPLAENQLNPVPMFV